MKLNDIFARVFSEAPEKISAEISTKNFRKWDSLAHVELLTAVEKAYGTRFSNAELTTLTSYAAILQALRKKGVDAET
jgi:acyl carrier protein